MRSPFFTYCPIFSRGFGVVTTPPTALCTVTSLSWSSRWLRWLTSRASRLGPLDLLWPAPRLEQPEPAPGFLRFLLGHGHLLAEPGQIAGRRQIAGGHSPQLGPGGRQLLLTDSGQFLGFLERSPGDQLGREERLEPLEIVAGVPQPLFGRRDVGRRSGQPGGLRSEER